jgi:hypothetical protein
MRFHRTALGASVFLGALLVSTTADAFCRAMTCNGKNGKCETDDNGCVTEGEPQHWEHSILTFRFHAAGTSQLVREEARAAVRGAFHRWSDVVCANGERTSLRFVEGEDIHEDKPLESETEAAESFGIFFRDLGWPHEGGDNKLAITRTLYRKTGVLTYADMEVNTTKHFSVDDIEDPPEQGGTKEAKDLQAVITHEVGHYIGLGHSRAPQSIMAERLCDMDGRCDKGRVAARRLAEDDMEAVCELFPPGKPTPPPEEKGTGPLGTSCRAASGSTGTTGSLAMLAGIVFAGSMVVARRRARRS